MADSKITALTSISTSTDPANDPLVIVDVSDTSMAATGTTKKVTLNQLLGASGTATLASATITGDLTVDTSTLKVDSANNRVGVNTATPAAALDVQGSSLRLQVQSSSNGAYATWKYIGKNSTGTAVNFEQGLNIAADNAFELYDNQNTQLVSRYVSGVSGAHSWFLTGTTAMTLNATGLGVGTSPVSKLTISDAAAYPIRVVATAGTTAGIEFQDPTTGATRPNIASRGAALTIETGGSERLRIDSTGLGVGVSPSFKLHVQENASNVIARFTGSNANGSVIDIINTGTGGGSYKIGSNYTIGGAGEFAIYDSTAGATRLLISSTGNVGIGVTASAWVTGKALQVGTTGTSLWGYADTTYLTQNAAGYPSTSFIYGTTNLAAAYQMQTGVHKWFNAPSGTAGTAITFTQAMTLDASGNLLVGKSVSLFSTVGVEASGTGFISATNSASTNATTNLSVYSTGAAAFRFYVGLGGTVYATNTTISAISDARLKENVQDIDVGLGAILALKPRKFDWKAGKGKDIKGDRGFIAQEFEQVFPQLVDEWKDEAPEGEAPYKSVRQDLIPVLVKAIQELAAEVNALKNA